MASKIDLLEQLTNASVAPRDHIESLHVLLALAQHAPHMLTIEPCARIIGRPAHIRASEQAMRLFQQLQHGRADIRLNKGERRL